MELKIAQINAARSAAAAGELRATMRDRGIEVLCIQEPYSVRGKVVGYNSPSVRVIQPNSASPWVAILIAKPEYEILDVATEASDHVVCVRINTGNETVHVINMYCQYRSQIEEQLETLGRLIRRIRLRERYPKIIVAADANAKSPLWHSGEADQRGRKLEDFIFEHELEVENRQGCAPTYFSVHGQSNIDVTLTSVSLSGALHSWTVVSDCGASDHNLIVYTIGGLTRPEGRRAKKIGYKTAKANWEHFTLKYEELMNDENKRKIANRDPDEAARVLGGVVAAVCSTTLKKKKARERAIPWWSLSLQLRRGEVRRAKKELARARRDRNPNVEQYSRSYSRLRNAYTTEIRRTKQETWRQFVHTEGNNDPWGIVYKITRDKMRRNEIPCSMTLPDGSVTMTWRETARALLKKMVPKDSRVGELQQLRDIRTRNGEYQCLNLEPEISEGEISAAIKATKPKKASGLDGIPPDVWKMIWAKDKETLKSLFNNILRKAKIPDIWKKAEVKTILKDPLRDRTSVDSYRPIALLPIVSKIFERIFVKRLQTQYGSTRNLPSEQQFGFKQGKCTEDAMVAFKRSVRNSEKKYVIAVFTDIQGAFDNL